jgi:hypothetical protein
MKVPKPDNTPKTDNISTETKVKEYINGQENKNQIILTQLREIIKNVDPRIAEEYKWGMPTYSYKGLMIYLRASKNHATLGFHNGSIMADPDTILEGEDNPKMRHIKIKLPQELDEELVIELVKRSMHANENK